MKTVPLVVWRMGLIGAFSAISLLCASAQQKSESAVSPGSEDSKTKPAAGKVAEKGSDSAGEPKGGEDRQKEGKKAEPPPLEALRLDVGGSGLLPGPAGSRGASEGASGGTSLGPLPEFKPLPRPAEMDPAEEPAFPDVEIRRRARPELMPDGPNPTEEAALSMQERIRFRAVKTQALRDSAVRDALEASVRARSERERREALQRHYTLLFARMRVLDPSLKGLIFERETAAIDQVRDKLPR